jgi:integrase/recombinase XerD
MEFASLWPIYKRDRTIARYSPHTIRAHEIQFNLLLRYAGNIEADNIDANLLKDYLASCTHLKASSLGMRVRFLKAFFTWAFTEKHIPTNPMVSIKEPRIKDKLPKYLTDDEIITLKGGCETLLERTLLEFSFATGCRVGEVREINRNDVNWENNSINIMGKGGKRRIIYFSEPCKELLQEYLEYRKDDDEALFVTERAPHRMSIAEMRYILKRIAKRAGMTNKVYPHKLRHTYATHLLNNGAPLEAIRQLLGHSNLSSTMIYANLTEQGKMNTYNRCFKG